MTGQLKKTFQSTRTKLLREDLTIHQKGTVSFGADVRTGGVHKRATSLFGCASDDGHHDAHDQLLEP